LLEPAKKKVAQFNESIARGTGEPPRKGKKKKRKETPPQGCFRGEKRRKKNRRHAQLRANRNCFSAEERGGKKRKGEEAACTSKRKKKKGKRGLRRASPARRGIVGRMNAARGRREKKEREGGVRVSVGGKKKRNEDFDKALKCFLGKKKRNTQGREGRVRREGNLLPSRGEKEKDPASFADASSLLRRAEEEKKAPFRKKKEKKRCATWSQTDRKEREPKGRICRGLGLEGGGERTSSAILEEGGKKAVPLGASSGGEKKGKRCTV